MCTYRAFISQYAVALFTLLTLGIVQPARAQCNSQLSASLNGTVLTATASSSGDCNVATVVLLLDGQSWKGVTCDTATCTITESIEMSCNPGPHTVGLDTGCFKNVTNSNGTISCTEYHGPHVEQTVNVPPPSADVAATYSPDEFGHGTVHTTWSFPNTAEGGAFHYVQVQFNGGNVFPPFNPAASSGSRDDGLTITCLRPGTYPLVSTGTACPGSHEVTTVHSTDVNVPGHPTVHLIVTPITSTPEPDDYLVSASYSFPNTDSSGQRSIQIKQNGVAVGGWNPTTISGTTDTITVRGCGELTAHAVSCIHDGDADFIADDAHALEPLETCASRNSCDLGATPGGGLPRGPWLPDPPQDAGRPINVGTGDVHLTLPLFTIDAPSIPLSLSLSYHSARPLYAFLSNEIAPGWTFPFNESLRSLGNDSPYLYRITATGEEELFQQAGTNTWSAIRPPKLHETITRVSNEYRSTDLQGSTRAYDATTGHWLRTTDRWNNTISATYDTNGNLTTITDTAGRQLTITATGTQLQQVTLPSGATWRFTYTNGNLSAIYDPLHTGTTPWRTFEYTTDRAGTPRLLTAIKDDAGAVIEGHTYYGDDRGKTSFAGANQQLLTIDYDYPTLGNRHITEQVTSTTSRTTDFTVALVAGVYLTTHITGGCTSCGSSSDTEDFQYDANHRLASRTDARGTTTQYTYDTNGNLLTITEAAGTARERTTTYTYANAAWPGYPTTTTRSGPNGSVTIQQTWNADETILTNSVTGKLVGGSTSATYTTTTTFDAHHRIASTDGPRTEVIDTATRTYYPDADPNVMRRGRIHTITTPNNLTTTYDNYDVYGTAGSITDPNGVTTSVVTDARGRTTSTTSNSIPTDPNENSNYTRFTAYDTRDRLASQTRPRGGTTAYAYENGTNALTDTTIIDNAGLQTERVHLTLNTNGSRAKEELQACTTPTTTCTSWITKRSEDYTYDTHARMQQITHADNTSVQYTYDGNGNTASVKDENHSTANTAYSYDELNRLTTVTQTLGAQTVSTTYTYDVANNLTSVTDPNGNLTTYAYDDFNRLQTQTSPVTGTTTYAYDAAANLVTSTDANGNTTSRAYDALNRVITITSTHAGAPTETLTYTYDDPTSGNYGRGRLATSTDPRSTTTYAYERRGLLRREARTIDGATYTSAYAYDADANRTTITTPSGRVVTYTYDSTGRPVGASSGGTSIVTSATYLPFGPRTTMTLGNGTTRTRTFDNRYRIVSNALTGTATIANYNYTTDNNGNITGVTDATNSAYNRTFTYDDLNRLTAAATGTALWGRGAYTYDAMGNLLTSSVGTPRTYTYTGTTPKLAGVTENATSSTVLYDAAGNETSVGAATYAYSPRNLLTTADGFTYDYDARGVRTISTIASTTLVQSVSALSVNGGTTSTATVTLASAPATPTGISLTSSDNLLALVPRTVTVNAGSTTATFPITTTRPTATTDVTISASYAGVQRTTLTVIRDERVSTLTVTPASLVGGNMATGTITLDTPAAAGGAIVSLSTSDSTTASVPTSITVPAGSTSTTFTITTGTVTQDTAVSITATRTTTASANLTVTPAALQLTSLAVNPANVVGGRLNSTGTITLTRAAPTGGASVTLTSSDTTAATVPTAVTVPAGAASTTFAVTTSTVGASTPVTITASFGNTQTATLTVAPCASWTADAATLGTETVWFDDALPTGATTVGTWIWDPAQKASGTQSSTSTVITGNQERYFYGATQTITAATAGDKLIVYTLLDPCNPPQEIMVQWNDGSWNHRAYWGANLISCGAESPSCHNVGGLPPVGVWTRLEVNAGTVNLRNRTINGMAFDVYSGKAWFDRAGKTSCTTSVAPPPTSLPSTDVVWVEDAIPTGGTPNGTWTWDTTQRASGTQAHTEPVADGMHQHLFTGATNTLSLATGDKLIAYVLLNPCDPPDEVMLQWNDGSWEHRAYWGANNIGYGADGTTSRYHEGNLPPTGQWVRLEVPVADVALAGRTITGMAFTINNGQAWFDRAGKSPSGSAALAPPPAPVVATTAPVAPLGVRARMAAWIRRVIARVHGPEPPVGLAVTTKVMTTVGTRRYSFYTPELHLLSETDLTSATTPTIAFDYAWFGGEPIAQIDSSGAVHYYFNDHLGSPLLTTDSGGVVDWRVEREPYGNRYAVRNGAVRRQPLDLPGQEVDENNGDVSYNIFRWYRSGWGRYTQDDPLNLGVLAGGVFPRSYNVGDPKYELKLRLAQPQRETPFGYAINNPVKAIDPSGLDAAGAVTWGEDCLSSPNPMLKTIGGTVAIVGIAMMLGEAWWDDLMQKPDTKKCKQCEKDSNCDAQLAFDENQCWSWWMGSNGRDVVRWGACKGSAMNRYSECLRDGTHHSRLSPTPYDL